eukprot:11216365-Lingulodinium_polyedra.AAC.1
MDSQFGGLEPGLLAGIQRRDPACVATTEPYCYLPVRLQEYILESAGHAPAVEAALQQGASGR